jgi:hypothetical protein
LIPTTDRFWADPFPVKFEEKYFVFFEEFIYKEDKAHISVVELSKSGAGESSPVLKRDYHLSYPFIFQWKDRYFMIPETAENRTVELYGCSSFPHDWKMETVLFEGEAARDATLIELEGLWWMFVAIADTEFSDELHLYYSPSPLDLYRPAQDSSRRYGYGMRINKVLRLSPTEFVEEEVSHVLPQWRRDLRGTHTLNMCEDLTVIDCLIHRKR